MESNSNFSSIQTETIRFSRSDGEDVLIIKMGINGKYKTEFNCDIRILVLSGRINVNKTNLSEGNKRRLNRGNELKMGKLIVFSTKPALFMIKTIGLKR